MAKYELYRLKKPQHHTPLSIYHKTVSFHKMAQDAGVDILNTFKKNRKDFSGEKIAKVANEQHCLKHTKKGNSLTINDSNIFKQYCSYEQNCSFPEKSNNPEKNRTILEGETFCGSFDHFLAAGILLSCCFVFNV